MHVRLPDATYKLLENTLVSRTISGFFSRAQRRGNFLGFCFVLETIVTVERANRVGLIKCSLAIVFFADIKNCCDFHIFCLVSCFVLQFTSALFFNSHCENYENS